MKLSQKMIVLSALFLLVFCTISTALASEISPKVNAFVEVKNGASSTVDVSLNIIPNDDMNISSMIFSIGYTYSYGDDYFNFTYNEDNTANNLVLDERFSDATVSNSHVYYDTFNYVWESSSPVSVATNELITLATISLDVADTAGEGEYIFTLDCSDFYCYEGSEDTDTGSFTDVIVEISQDDYYFWLGEKMSANTSLFSIVVSGTEEISDIISVTKNVDASQCYIMDTSVAEIVDIQNFDDDAGAFISIVGRKVGTTTLVVKGGYQNIEEVFVTIKVVKPKPYILSVSKTPKKTTYSIGEELDLSGLELKVIYDNNDIEYVSFSSDIASDFVVDTYDFTTAGDKQIEIYYGGRSAKITVTVESDMQVILYGDGNDDGLVDTKDLVLLRRYLANYNYDTGLSTVEIGDGGDANGDGVIDTKDLVLIRRYLANYNYDTGFSTIILGPQN